MSNKRVLAMGIGVPLMALVALMLQSERVYAATASALVEVRVLFTMSITTLRGLSFGAISASPTVGSVTIQPDGTIVSAGGVTVADATAAGAASFQLSGQPNTVFTVQLPTGVQLTDTNGDSLLVSNFQSLPSLTGQLDSSGNLVMNVGGTLEVGALQAAGTYSGMMAVSVNYY